MNNRKSLEHLFFELREIASFSEDLQLFFEVIINNNVMKVQTCDVVFFNDGIRIKSGWELSSNKQLEPNLFVPNDRVLYFGLICKPYLG